MNVNLRARMVTHAMSWDYPVLLRLENGALIGPKRIVRREVRPPGGVGQHRTTVAVVLDGDDEYHLSRVRTIARAPE